MKREICKIRSIYLSDKSLRSLDCNCNMFDQSTERERNNEYLYKNRPTKGTCFPSVDYGGDRLTTEMYRKEKQAAAAASKW